MTEGTLSWGQRLWWLVTGRINGEVVPPVPRTPPPPDPPRPSYIPKCFPGVLASQGFPAGTPWLGDAEHMSDVDPSLTAEEVAQRREAYAKMTNAEQAAEWGVDVTETPARIVPYVQWVSGVPTTLDRVRAAKLAHLSVTPETIAKLREELSGSSDTGS